MSRIIFLIDGFNLYHALDYRREYHKYKWVNLAKLSQCFVTDKKDSFEGVYYFTTLATWDPGKVVRHRLFITAQETEGVKVVYGEFKRKDRFCPLCQHLRTSRFDDAVILADGSRLICPPNRR
jgi:hypothetical protein